MEVVTLEQIKQLQEVMRTSHSVHTTHTFKSFNLQRKSLRMSPVCSSYSCPLQLTSPPLLDLPLLLLHSQSLLMFKAHLHI